MSHDNQLPNMASPIWPSTIQIPRPIPNPILHQAMNRSEPIIVEQHYDVSKAVLWGAISEREQMIQWFFQEIPDFKAESGFETQFNVSTDERDFNHLWKITEAVDNERIVYDWRYEGYEGAGEVIFEVFDSGDGSGLRVTCNGIESFQAGEQKNIPEFARESGEAGWKYFVQDALKNYLDAKS